MTPVRSKIICLGLLLAMLCCKAPDTNSDSLSIQTKYVKDTTLQGILNTAMVTGNILVYDLQEDTYYSNDFELAKEARLPASTFKIPNTIIGLETGVIDKNYIFKWDGKPRGMKIWEKDLVLTDAFQISCVPCYQGLARTIGVDTMKHYLEKLKFGNMEVDQQDLDRFWLVGKSSITPEQQIEFLINIYTGNLSISPKTISMIKDIMIVEEKPSHILRGKSGWSIVNEDHNGWFVGYVIKDNKPFFFSTNISPNLEFDMADFPSIRKEITLDALNQMRIIN